MSYMKYLPFLLVATAFVPNAALAFSAPTTLPNPTVTTTQAFWNLLCSGVIYFFGIVILIAFVMLLVAALNFMTAGGDEHKVEVARKMLLYGVIGVAVALLARAILQVVASLFGIDFGGLFGC